MRKAELDSTVGYTDILFAVLGISPAILTETVWALAQERPPFIPHKIVVITTRCGMECLQKSLFFQGGWERLKQTLARQGLPESGRLQFGMASDHIRVLPKADGSADLDDITTSADSEAAADFIMRSLREFTEDTSTRIVASIAGGRKTMGALLTSCMVLLGRKQDRLCHVLVNPPFDSPQLEPLFLFPESGIRHALPQQELTYDSQNARIELTDLPFVRVRGWHEQRYRKTMPSYMTMVRQIQGRAPDVDTYPRIEVDLSRGHVLVGEKDAGVSSSELALFSVLLRRMEHGVEIRTWNDIALEMENLYRSADASLQKAWLQDFHEKRFDLKEDARKLASSLRRKMAVLLPDPSMAEKLVPSPKTCSIGGYPLSRIHILR